MRQTTALMAALALTLIVTGWAPPMAEAKTLSAKEVAVTQVKIVYGGGGQSSKTPTSWGIDSGYIGPGDINRLVAIDIYLDAEQRIAYVKVTRESYTGDVASLLFSKIKEISIQSLKPGANRPHKKIPITIHTADSLTFP